MAKYSPRFFPPLSAPRAFKTHSHNEHLSQGGKQKVTFWLAKGMVLPSKRYAFGARKVWFCNAKGMLSSSPPCGFAGSGALLGKSFFRKEKSHIRQSTIKQSVTNFSQRHHKGNDYRIEPKNSHRNEPRIRQSYSKTRLRKTIP